MGDRNSTVFDFPTLIRFINGNTDALDRRVSRLFDELAERINAIRFEDEEESVDIPSTLRPYVFIVSSEASTDMQELADYLCDGSNDTDQIIAANDDALLVGKYLYFSPGTFFYNPSDTIVLQNWQGWAAGQFHTIESSISGPAINSTRLEVDLQANMGVVFEVDGAFQNLSVRMVGAPFTLDSIIQIDSSADSGTSIVSDSGFQTNNPAAVSDSYLITGSVDGATATLINLRFASFNGTSDGDTTVPAIRVANQASAHIRGIDVQNFDAPAVWLHDEGVGAGPSGCVISNIYHRTSDITPDNIWVVFDEAVDNGGNSDQNIIDCASILNNRVDDVLASNVCGDPNGGLPIVITP